MQIMVNIDEKTYEQLKFLIEQGFGTVIDEAVANGIPLPKGHGRLIDADAFNDELNNCDYDTYNDYSNTFDWIEEASTIIEADKTESEDKE